MYPAAAILSAISRFFTRFSAHFCKSAVILSAGVLTFAPGCVIISVYTEKTSLSFPSFAEDGFFLFSDGCRRPVL